MKKFVLTCFLSASAMMAGAQSPYLDAAEDTTHVVTIADVVNLQERVTSQQSTSSHFGKVWGYKSYFNIAYLNSAKLTPKEPIKLGFEAINSNKVPEFKADYGVALQLGHSYNLHKKPIANTLYINLDFTYIDLSMAHYKQEATADGKVYNSDNTYEEKDKEGYTNNVQYIPWCLEKYDINYGMNIGPSLTIAPFTHLNINGLHFLKFNIYYHIGYQAGVLWMLNDKKANAAENQSSFDADPLKMNWQHGMTQSFGFNISWRAIGIGFETRSDSRKYKAFDTSTYGNGEYKFDGKNSRIYLKICY